MFGCIVLFCSPHRLGHGLTAENFSMMGFLVVLVAVITDELNEDRAEQGENERLHGSYKQFHEVEWKGWQPGKIKLEALRDQVHQRFQRLLTTVDVPKETEAESYWADRDGNDLQQPDEEEDRHHQHHHDSFEITFGSKDVGKKAAESIFRNSPVEPEDGECESHGRGHVQIGIAPAKERLEVTVSIFDTYRAHPWNQAKPVTDKNKEENRTKKPKDALYQVRTKQTTQKVIERLDQPFGKVLETGRNQSHLAGGQLAEKNDHSDRHPNHQHGVGNRKPPVEAFRVKRKTVVFFSSKAGTKPEKRSKSD